MRWWDIASKICMETGSILLLNSMIMQIFKKSKLIKGVTIKLFKTKVVLPIFLVASSIAVSLIMSFFRFLVNSNDE